MALSSFSSLAIVNSFSSTPTSLNRLFIISSPQPTQRASFIIASSSNSTSDVTASDLSSKEKKILREQYGFDADQLPSPKKRGRKGSERKRGKDNEVALEEPKPARRTTHKLLQVLGGTAKRKKLLSPNSMDVRPMMEVVKGAAFDILQVAGGCPASLRPGRWLDLYSGTGSVGIEALSRGCAEVHFVEMDPWVVTEVLRPNLEWTGFLDASVIHTVPVESFLDRAEKLAAKDGPFDYMSITPPYTVVDYSVLMGQISKSALVGENTFIVVEYPIKTDMMESCGCLVKISDRRFGRTHLAIYGPQWAQKKGKLE